MKIKLLSLSLMCAVSLFAMPWHDVKTQEDIAAVPEEHKTLATKALQIKQDPEFTEAVKSYQKAKELVKKYSSNGLEHVFLGNMKEFRGVLPGFAQDSEIPYSVKLIYISYYDKETKLSLIKDGIVERFTKINDANIKICAKNLDLYIKNLIEFDPAESKTILRKLNMIIYPRIGENAQFKDMAVKIRLALESLD